jgi:poly(A) polymerase
VLHLLGSAPSFPLAFAALLHDIGKRRTLGRTPERYTFYNHEVVGRSMAAQICRRLKFSNYERERIEWLVLKHQYLSDAPHMRPSKIKATLAHPGVRELLDLHRADAVATGCSTAHVEYCERLLKDWTETELNPPFILTGDHLKSLGVAPGPVYKETLEAAREAQLDGALRTTDEALAWAKERLGIH